MTGAREPIEPTHDVPLSIAAEEINGFETLAIEAKFGAKLENLGGTALMMGLVYVYENRGDGKRSWASVQAMTLRELHGYFPPEPEDLNPDDPDSDMGKESGTGDRTTPS